MGQESIQAIKGVIESWKNVRKYTFEGKFILAHNNPIMNGEMILQCGNRVYSFFLQ